MVSKFQAHKIFERQAFEKGLKLQGKALDEAVEKAPAIILTNEQHLKISNALAAGWRELKKTKTLEKITKADLQALYKQAYAANPHWLDAIESYLR